ARGRIVRAGLPQAAAAGLPRVGVVLPGLAALLARLGDGIPAPQLVAGLDVERRDPAARRAVAGAVRHQHLAVDDERRRVEALLVAALVGDGDLLVPHDLARVAVDRDDAPVRQVGDHLVFPQRDAARARQVALVPHAGIADPHELALVGIARVDLVDRAPAVARVHESVVDQR